MKKGEEVIGKTVEGGYLSEEEVYDLCSEALSAVYLRDKSVLVIIPDHTRSAPVGLFFRYIHKLIGEKVKSLDYLVPLGTHPYLVKRRFSGGLKNDPGFFRKILEFNLL